MSYSTIIHSSLVNPAKPNLVKESDNDPLDTVTLDVPLLTRILELAREDLKTDADLHDVVTNILALKNQGTLTMNDYDKIVQKQEVNVDSAELESILKLAGI
jgi:hypothetical protein